MSTLSKMSDIIYSNSLCYYKVPLDYNENTDLYRYKFTVAAKDVDYEFNAHAFDAGDYQPEAEPPNDTRGLYKKKVIISGTFSDTEKNDRDIDIQIPRGLVKNKDGIIVDNDYINHQALLDTTCAGFTNNKVVFGTYSDSHDNFLIDDYHGVVTGFIYESLGSEGEDASRSTYWTFMAKISISGSSEDDNGGFYAIGATSSRMKYSELTSAINEEFKSVADYVIPLPLSGGYSNYEKEVQIYSAKGNQYTIPSDIRNIYSKHMKFVTNAVVLWEQCVAWVPEPYSTSSSKIPRDKDSVIVCNFGKNTITQLDCYLAPSTSSIKIGSITGCTGTQTATSKVKVYRYYDIATSYDNGGRLHVWLRIGDPKEDNHCWIEYTQINSKVCTVTKAQSCFSFQLNTDEVENFDAFNWKYAVVSKTHNTAHEKYNTFNRIGTGTSSTDDAKYASIWYDFVWNSEGNDILITGLESSEGEGLYPDTLSALIWHGVTSSDNRKPGTTVVSNITEDETAAAAWFGYTPTFIDPPITNPNNGKANNNNTYVSAEDSYRWLYILAEANTFDGLMPYQIKYLDSDVATVATYVDNKAYKLDRGATLQKAPTETKTVVGNYYYLFRYRVDDPDEVTFIVSSEGATTQVTETIYKSNFSDLIITPVIKDNKVQIYGDVIYPEKYYRQVSSEGVVTGFTRNQVGALTFKQVIDYDGSEGDTEVSVPGNRFSRGATIRVTAIPKNGWIFKGFSSNTISDSDFIKESNYTAVFTLPISDEYEVCVIRGEFVRKTNPITIIITNTDIRLGDVLTNFDNEGSSVIQVTTNDNEQVKTISCFESDILNLKALPHLLDSEGINHNTGQLARWEYFYNTDENDLEKGYWRLINNVHDYTFTPHLWQTEGVDDSKKNIYKYQAIWGQKVILY